MAGIYTVQRLTGVTPDVTTITNCRLHTDDTPNNQDLTTPIPIAGVLKRSYWATIELEFSGTFSQIGNIRHYCDGTIGFAHGTSGALQCATAGVTRANYVQATGVSGDSGDEMVANHTNVAAKADIETYTTGSPLTVDSTDYTSADASDGVVLQQDVDTDATSGLQTAETLTWRVDEI